MRNHRTAILVTVVVLIMFGGMFVYKISQLGMEGPFIVQSVGLILGLLTLAIPQLLTLLKVEKIDTDAIQVGKQIEHVEMKTDRMERGIDRVEEIVNGQA